MRFTKELTLDLPPADRALNRTGKLTDAQVETVREAGKRKTQRLLIAWPIAALVAVGGVVIWVLATGGSLDATVFLAVAAVFVALGVTFLLLLGPQFWLLYFRPAKRASIVPWETKAKLGAATSNGTVVRFGNAAKGVTWRLPDKAAQSIIDGGDYTVYRNGEILHWFEPTGTIPAATDAAGSQVIDVTHAAATGAPPTPHTPTPPTVDGETL